MKKNLEKLSKNKKKKLLIDLDMVLTDLEQISIEIKRDTNNKGYKISKLACIQNSYNHLLGECKKYGVNATKKKKVYNQMMDDLVLYLRAQLAQSYSRMSIRTQYGDEFESDEGVHL